MRLLALGLAISAAGFGAVTISAPAKAELLIPPPYTEPFLPNYLSPPGRASCTWYDMCWYTIVTPTAAAVAPVVAAPAAARRPVKKH